MGYDNNLIQSKCVVCEELVANKSIKTSKLKRNLDRKHPNFNEITIDYV